MFSIRKTIKGSFEKDLEDSRALRHVVKISREFENILEGEDSRTLRHLQVLEGLTYQ
jgi:hypothetical protein